MNKKKILVAIPAYNEGESIGALIKSIKKHNLDVLLVDDGSEDNTVDIASKYNISIIKHEYNKGLSEVYSSFIDYAVLHSYTHIITLDSDGQHDPELIPEFVKLLHKSDLIIGNRFANTKLVPNEKLSSNFFASTVTKSIFGKFLPDISCGYRSYSISFLKSLNIDSSSFGVIYQSVFECLKNGMVPLFVDMLPNYLDSPMETNTNEVLSLILEANNYDDNAIFDVICKKLESGQKFELTLLDIDFQFRPSNKSAFVISTNIDNAKSYYIN